MTTLFDKLPPLDETVEICRIVVRVKTCFYSTRRGLHTRRDIIFLHSRCQGCNFLEEDAVNIGPDEVIPRIINLGQVPDGLYTVVTCHEHKDWETGHIEDYNYQLLPFTE